VRLDREAKDAQADVEIVLPDRRVPISRAAFEILRAPDVVDQHIDATVIGAKALGQASDMVGVQMIDLDRASRTAQPRDQFGRLFDRLRAVVVRSAGARHAAAPGADDRRARFTQSCGDATPGAPESPLRPRRHDDAAHQDPATSPHAQSASQRTRTSACSRQPCSCHRCDIP